MQDRVPRWQMILYSSGSLATALSYQAFATYIQFFYIDILGLKAASVGLVWSVYGLWNAINDPLAGYWSDRTQTRWGRRVPWIAALFLPLSLTFYFLWLPPAGLIGAQTQGLLLYFLAMVLGFDFLWTIVVMNWTALFPEMVPEARQRASVSAWRQIFSLVGLLVGVALPPILAGEDWSNRGGMAALLSLVTAISFGTSLLGSRERKEFQQDRPLPLKAAIQATIGNRDFLFFLGANLMIQFLFLALTSTVPFYTKYVLKIQTDLMVPTLNLRLDVGMQNSIFLGTAFIVALPAMPVWTALAHRAGAWKTLRLACLSVAASLLLFFWAAGFYSGLLCVLIFGLNLAGLLMLPDLLIADLVDADELATGTRREGLYFGMNGLVIRLAFTIQGIITGSVLTAAGYISPSETVLYPQQPDAVITGIRWMLAGIPATAMLIAFATLQHFSLHGQKMAVIRERVNLLHAAKQARSLGDGQS